MTVVCDNINGPLVNAVLTTIYGKHGRKTLHSSHCTYNVDTRVINDISNIENHELVTGEVVETQYITIIEGPCKDERLPVLGSIDSTSFMVEDV